MAEVTPLQDAFEGVAFTINTQELTGRCLTLREGLRFSRLYELAMDAKAPKDESHQAAEQLIAEFPVAIGHPELRMTLTEFFLVLRRFLYLHRGAPAPVERTDRPTPAPPTTASTAPALTPG
jgi:hypothetical protein